MELERIALHDDDSIEKKLYPDQLLEDVEGDGLPGRDRSTVLFAVARTVGWIAQWKEMDPTIRIRRIGRPRQLYTGATAQE